MKPPPFRYHAPRSKAEALDMLAGLNECRVLAGGQSLVPMLNFRLLAPDHLVDINRIPELRGIEAIGSALRIGAMTRQAAIDSMNAGFGLVTHIGHGFRYTMSLGDASLTNLQAAALTNSARPFFLVMLNCTASAYDFPCLAEQFILNPHVRS